MKAIYQKNVIIKVNYLKMRYNNFTEVSVNLYEKYKNLWKTVILSNIADMEDEKRIQNNGGYAKMLRANNLKQVQVAAFTGLSANTISGYGRDIRGIRIGHLQDIAKFLHVDVQTIISQMLYFDKQDAKKKKK